MSLQTPQKQHDEKILACRAALSQLNEARNNDCSATRKLSLEILATIFRYAVRPYTKRYSPKAMRISHVCRSWRKAALDEPCLWGNLDGLTDQWTSICFKRSKGAPLRIRYRDKHRDASMSDTYSDSDTGENKAESAPDDSEYTDDPPEGWYGPWPVFPQSKQIRTILLENSTRLEQLHIESCQPDTIPRLNQPAPHLSSLTVSGTSTFPADFLGGIAPSGLHTVKLQRCSLSLEGWSKNVRHLQLSRCKLRSDVFAALSAMEHLQDLRISFHKDPLASVVENKSYVLPNLHTAAFTFRAGHQHIPNAFPAYLPRN